MTFAGILNVKLIEVELNSPEDGLNKDLFVSVDQHPVYQTVINGSKSTLNENFSSKVNAGNSIKLTIFNESSTSIDDILANCMITFEDILKKEKKDGLFDIKVDLQPNGGSAHFAVELIENVTNENHQSAIRKKVHQVNGHKFQAALLKQPSYCSHCDKFIFGLGLQGYKCKCCNEVVHKKCHQKVQTKCKRTKPTIPELEMRQEERTHDLKAKHFLTPTFCNHCGTLIYGLYKQGLSCKDCKIHVHKRCHDYVPENCSNQQMQNLAAC